MLSIFYDLTDLCLFVFFQMVEFLCLLFGRCFKCNFATNDSKTLKLHCLKHDLSCNVCGEQFDAVFKLKAHENQEHVRKKPGNQKGKPKKDIEKLDVPEDLEWGCKHCESVFYGPSGGKALVIHRKNAHPHFSNNCQVWSLILRIQNY